MPSIKARSNRRDRRGLNWAAGWSTLSGMSAELPAHHAATQDRALASARLVLGGIALNAGLAAIKFAGGIFGHSFALIADGAESLLDILSSLLVWAGFRVASRPPDANHPFGHGRAEPLTALAGVIFIFITAAWIGFHAIHGIRTPHQGPYWATLPLLAGIVVTKVWLFRKMGAAGAAAGSMALDVEAWHHGSDALTSAAAFIGIAIAVVGGPGWEAADSWAALFACVVIVFNGVSILVKTLSEMMDTAVSPAISNQIRALAGNVPGVGALDKCRVRKSGLSFLVDIHVRVDGNLSVVAGHNIGHAVKNVLLASDLRVTDVSVHVEPMIQG